jgi:putative ABC transport system permease protein
MHSLRRLFHRPGFTSVAVATLALGIGGVTAIFSVADAVILRPLPFEDPERLALMWQASPVKNQPFVELSYPEYREWRAQARSLSDVAGMVGVNQNHTLSGRGEPTVLQGRMVTPNFFAVLGASALLGRTLQEEDASGDGGAIVLSHAAWQARFGGDPNILGQKLTLGEAVHTVVGVMPKAFAYPKGVEVWTPILSHTALAKNEGVFWMVALGRLRPGVLLTAGTAELSSITERYMRDRWKDPGFQAVLNPLSDSIFGATRPALLALLGAVSLVLLIACANVAGLLMVRLTDRRSELAVRQALGASLAGLARDVVAEAAALAGAGGLLGAAVAYVLTPALVALAPSDVPRLADVAVDLRALGVAAAVSAVCIVFCALPPVLLLRRLSLESYLREGARGVVSARNPLRTILVVGEVALALVLLVGAGLLFRSFTELERVPLGYEPRGVLTLAVPAPQSRYPKEADWRAFYKELLRRVSAVPGVTSAASVTLRPLWGSVGLDAIFTVEGQSKQEADRNPYLNFEAVSADYFRTMGIALKRGRVISEDDADGREGVVVVSESFARRFWPDADPIGKRLKTPQPGTSYHDSWLRVVGVVADARYRELQAARLDLYMSYLQSNARPHHVVVRTAFDPLALVRPIREIVQQLDPGLPLTDVASMTELVSRALGEPRFAARLFGAFALIALLLAALGLYGLLAYSVSRRTQEIGVRVALGARPSDVRRMVVREGLRLVMGGLALGLLGAAAAARLLTSLLFGVRPVDPPTFAAVASLLLAVAALACLLPASRAARVDPAVALRAE